MVTQPLSADWYSMSDPAIVSGLCRTLKQVRFQQNLTQEQLAGKAGLSRSAISEMENGKTAVSFITIIQVMRALQQFHLLDNWKVSSSISPLAVAKLSSRSRKRASGVSIKKDTGDSEW